MGDLMFSKISEIFKSFKQKFKNNKEAKKYIDKPVIAGSAKEIATAKKEPYVAVLDTHVNKDNIRNGFFELDWNEYFVLQLREAGYKGTSEEEMVDQWFQDLCRNIGAEEGIDMERRGSGHVNVSNIGNGRAEIS
jgi:hypothetical protein